MRKKGRPLIAAKKIRAHKLVQIKGYKTLIKRAKDERIRQLLVRITGEEEKQAAFWSDRIRWLGGEREGASGTWLRDLKAKLLMTILGTKGFFEWAVVGEEEGSEICPFKQKRSGVHLLLKLGPSLPPTGGCTWNG